MPGQAPPQERLAEGGGGEGKLPAVLAGATCQTVSQSNQRLRCGGGGGFSHKSERVMGLVRERDRRA